MPIVTTARTHEMHTTRLEIEYTFDFIVFAVVTSAKEFKLAWELNQLLRIDLQKQQDIRLEFLKNADLNVSNFLFETEHMRFRLLKNKSVSERPNAPASYLIPEHREYDYLFQVLGANLESYLKVIPQVVRTSTVIEYFAVMDITTLKSKENLIL